MTPRGRDNAGMHPTPATVRPARREDVRAIVALIRALAVYEKLEHLATAPPEALEPQLFGERPACECLVGEQGGAVVGFALFFPNFSTFLCRPGLYLEDLYVQPAARGTGLGRQFLVRLAQIAVERGCGRAALRMERPRLERRRAALLRTHGRDLAARLAHLPRHRGPLARARRRRVLSCPL